MSDAEFRQAEHVANSELLERVAAGQKKMEMVTDDLVRRVGVVEKIPVNLLADRLTRLERAHNDLAKFVGASDLRIDPAGHHHGWAPDQRPHA